MPIFAMVPTKGERDELLEAIKRLGHALDLMTDARMPTHHVRSLRLTVTLRGLGKCHFAVQTQDLLGRDCWDLVVMATELDAVQIHGGLGVMRSVVVETAVP